jgi:hypothetical protein
MESTLHGTAGESLSQGERSAVQNTSSAATTIKLLLLWLAVGLPLLWGVVKQLEDVRNILP